MAERPRLIRKIDIADARELAARRCDAGFSESSPAKHVDVCVESDEDRGSIPLASILIGKIGLKILSVTTRPTTSSPLFSIVRQRHEAQCGVADSFADGKERYWCNRGH